MGVGQGGGGVGKGKRQGEEVHEFWIDKDCVGKARNAFAAFRRFLFFMISTMAEENRLIKNEMKFQPI